MNKTAKSAKASSAGKPKKPALPQSECDLVMKGGITSGVIYPRAVSRFAERFTLRSIGGTSAGAIAAAGAAAAEYGRSSGKEPRAFSLLESMAEELGQREKNCNTVLYNLFQPQAETRPYYNVIVEAFLSGGDKLYTKIFKALFLLLKNFPVTAIVTTVVAFICMYVFLALTTGSVYPYAPVSKIIESAWGWQTIFLIIDLAAIVVIVLLIRFLIGINKVLCDNGYGLCSGMPGAGSGDPLSVWLHYKIQDLAGLERDGRPLTFGDLWKCRGGGTPLTDGFDGVLKGNDCDVELRTVTTNITHGRPYSIPFEKHIFFYKKKELEKYFPDKVVEWMLCNQRHRKNKRFGEPPTGYCGLPLPKDLPVLVAARMSLSFPVLLSALPLYAFDYRKKPAMLTKCWFSDGGECSNFPIHFFDSALPSRPTFGLNLLDWKKGEDHRFDNADEKLEGVYMIKRNEEGRDSPQNWQPVKNIIDFLLKIFNSAANWRDNTQATVPGFCDRIAHIGVQKHEGGLNLNMEPEVIAQLANRGFRAAEVITRRFTEAHHPEKNPMSWDNHRWIRFLSTMMLNQKQFALLKDRLGGNNDYARLMKKPPSYDKSYSPGDYQKAVAELLKAVNAWLKIVQTPNAPKATLKDDLFISRAPTPHPLQRMTARI